VHLFQLEQRRVALTADIFHSAERSYLPSGISDRRLYQRLESGIRYLQGKARLPYFALFDSVRFYNAVSRCLPAYDVCHEHNGLFSFGAALACRRTGTPYVLTVSADPILELSLVGKSLRGLHAIAAARIARFTYQTAQAILCVSEPAKRHLSKAWRVDSGKIRVMPNGVDLDLFGQTFDSRALRAEHNLGEAPVVMFVGGFEPWHGLDGLIDGFVQVTRVLPKARLILVGDGPVRDKLEKQTAASGIQHAVSFTGLIPHGRIPEYLALADVVTLPYPSLPEELWFSPLKLYEYMAAGKAILASRAGQIAEVIQDGQNGLLVEPGDNHALAQGMILLLQDAGLRARLGEQARQQAVNRHSWDQYIRRLEDIYRMVQQENSGAVRAYSAKTLHSDGGKEKRVGAGED
jgi:glycosyltransferase involved in cell wall biosynthesis